MNCYDLLSKVVETIHDKEIYYFENAQDAINTLGGDIVCGCIEQGQTYLQTCEPLEDEVADCIFHHYGDYWLLYKVED
ncbi:MAG: hypothetical protein IKU96_00405 [Alistipes sp.]|nr:hypothetical protein [Alistipes sp.]